VKEISNYIDRLTLSIQCLTDNTCKKILRIPLKYRQHSLEKIISNLEKYFLKDKKKQLRSNTVLNKLLPISELQKIINIMYKTKFQEIHITYPDIDDEIDRKYIKYLLINKNESLNILKNLKLNIKTKLTDFPICFVPLKQRKHIAILNSHITKIHIKNNITFLNRDKILPRKREKIKECKSCKYKNICRGYPVYYIN
jgi:hypothetical protein